MNDPIYSHEAEQATLGAMMLSEKACGECGFLKTEYFWLPAHQHLFDCVTWLYVNAKPIDIVTIKDRLAEKGRLDDVGGAEYLIQVAESVPTATVAKYYADIVRDKWVLRTLESRIQGCLNSIRHPDMEMAEKVEGASTLVQGLMDISTYEFHVSDIVYNLSQKLPPGLPSGIEALDTRAEGGFYPDEPNMVCAMTGVGKSVLGNQMARRWCQMGKRGVIIGLEMNRDKVTRRLIKTLCGHGSEEAAIRDGAGEQFKEAQAEIAGWDLIIYDPSNTGVGSKDVESIREWIIAKHEHRPLDFVIVDYAQYLRSRERTRGKVELMERINQELIDLNKRCGFVMIVLAQLIKTEYGLEIRNSREFSLGAALEVHLVDEGTAMQSDYVLKCKKNRNGKNYWETGLDFDTKFLTFRSK